MKTGKIMGTTLSVLLFLALALYSGYSSTQRINPFSTATWVLALALALAIIAAGLSEVLRERSLRCRALLAGCAVLAAAVAFAGGVVYTLQATLHVPDVLSSYTQELTAPAAACALSALVLLLRAAFVARSPAGGEDERAEPGTTGGRDRSTLAV